ncbi:hypothetical protein WJX84_007969 [Apatococcus fuscideae]|uniref:SCP domain-containing protein n=1 Tax=Apatococcus fuscideae TaxID=2026836 RepID=A0AAW1TFF0_9CHLO
MRTAPEAFASAINAVCSLNDFVSSITVPRRGPLTESPTLVNVAAAHSDDESLEGYFDHYSPAGSSPSDRIMAVLPNITTLAEVLAAGYSTVQEVLVRLMCSAQHRAILTSCAYDSIGWGVAFNSSTESSWPDYFTGNLICSKAAGCTCPPAASEFSNPSAGPAAAPAVAPTTEYTPIFSPPQILTSMIGAQRKLSQATQPLGAPQSSSGFPYAAPPMGGYGPMASTGAAAAPLFGPGPSVAIAAAPPPMALSPRAISSSMASTVVSFEATYTQIAAASVATNELVTVVQHLATSILTYTGSAAQPTLEYIPTSGDPALYSPASSAAGRRHLMGAEQANPASAWDASYWTNRMQTVDGPRRSLLQTPNTLQPNVTFTITLVNGGANNAISDVASAISAFSNPVPVTTTASLTTDNTGAMVVALFPPNNQLSSTVSTSTSYADQLSGALKTLPSSVFGAAFVTNHGPYTITNVNDPTPTVPFPATITGPASPSPLAYGAPVIPSSPVPSPSINGSSSLPYPSTITAPTPPPPPSGSATSPESLVSALQTSPGLVLGYASSLDGKIVVGNVTIGLGAAAAFPGAAPVSAPIAPSAASGLAPGPSEVFTVPASPGYVGPGGTIPVQLPDTYAGVNGGYFMGAPVASSMAPAAAPQMVGPTTSYGFGSYGGSAGAPASTLGSPGTIEDYMGPSLAPPPDNMVVTPAMAPSPAYSFSAGGSMYAINMQLGSAQASTDQSSATLAIVFNTPPPGLRTTDFSLATGQGGQGSNVTAVAPYLSNSIYIMQVQTPANYYGNVTVAYASSSVPSITYAVTRQAAVDWLRVGRLCSLASCHSPTSLVPALHLRRSGLILTVHRPCSCGQRAALGRAAHLVDTSIGQRVGYLTPLASSGVPTDGRG